MTRAPKRPAPANGSRKAGLPLPARAGQPDGRATDTDAAMPVLAPSTGAGAPTRRVPGRGDEALLEAEGGLSVPRISSVALTCGFAAARIVRTGYPPAVRIVSTILSHCLCGARDNATVHLTAPSSRHHGAERSLCRCCSERQRRGEALVPEWFGCGATTGKWASGRLVRGRCSRARTPVALAVWTRGCWPGPRSS